MTVVTDGESSNETHVESGVPHFSLQQDLEQLENRGPNAVKHRCDCHMFNAKSDIFAPLGVPRNILYTVAFLDL